MSTPTEVAPIENAAPSDSGGFIDSIDTFFNEPAVENTPEVTPEVTPEPVQSTPESSKTDDSTPQSDPNDPLADIDSLDEPKDWTPQAARRFKELKNELKEYRTKAETYQNELTQREARLQELEAVSNNPEFQQLQERIEQYEQRMLLTDLENSSAFKNTIHEPLSQLVSEADSIAEKYGIESNTLLDVLALSDEATQDERLSEVLANASDRDKSRIYRIIEEIQPILAQRSAILENAAEAAKEAEYYEQQKQQAQLVERVQQRREAADAVAEKLQSKLKFLSSMDGLDMKQVAKEAAEFDPSTLDPVTGTYQAMAAKLLPKMAAQYISLQKEIDNLTERLADFDRASPKAGGGAAPAFNKGSVGGDKSFVDAVAAAFGG